MTNWGSIEVRGARENNLRDVSLDIPKRQLTVFTGVSGSGKSSLVFETIAAESRRLIDETYTTFVQGFMPTRARPDVDALENLTAAIIVDQERMGANARSTVGTATDAYDLLRVIFSRLGQPNIGPSSAFSFNVPAGTISGEITLEKAGSETESRQIAITGGSVRTAKGWAGCRRSTSTRSSTSRSPSTRAPSPSRASSPAPGITASTPTRASSIPTSPSATSPMPSGSASFTARRRRSSSRTSISPISGSSTRSAAPLSRQGRRLASGRTSAQPSSGSRPRLPAPSCDGTRLNATARSSLIRGKNIAECAAMQISDLAVFLRGVDDPSTAPIVGALGETLESMVHIGLGYLSLDRESSTLSGGEAQRTKMVRHLGSALTDVTYVFDEPTIGLHAHDVQQMNSLLQRLRDKGNTVLVVEHEADVIRIADHVVDMGPRAGSHGGEVVYEGPFDGLGASRHAHRPAGNLSLSLSRRAAGAEDRGAHAERRDPDPQCEAPQPAGRLGRRADRRAVAVTGVAGSGKSSLIHGCMPRTDPSVTVIDQSAIRGSRRSNPATYTGILDPIRKAFAWQKVKPRCSARTRRARARSARGSA